MGSPVVSNSRTCMKHLCTWVVNPLYFRPGLPQHNIMLAVRFIINPHTQFYSTKGGKQAQLHSRVTKEKGFTPRTRPAFPSPVFSAGTAKKTAEFMKKRAGMATEEPSNNIPARGRGSLKVVLPDHPLTTSEWAKFKEGSSKPERFEVQMMEGLLVANADVNIAKSLLAYVIQDKGTLSYELLLRYLTLCVTAGHHSEVFDTYDIMRTCFKTLDTGASTLFIKGFSQTERWREALAVLEGMKKALLPSPRNYGDAIAGAVLHGDTETSWKLYDELLEQGLVPNQDTWQCLFQSGITQRGQEDKLFSVLSYLRDNQIYPEELLIKTIKAWFESLPDQKWSGKFSFVALSGECKNCKASLESIQLTEEEYAHLKDEVMKKVIEGSDIFNKTTPEELKSFKSFVKQRPPFDIVIDGLNVANTTPKATHSETLLAVVSELEQQGLNILVLGRKHMLQPTRNWDRQNMNKIKQKAHCFFTENISEDDPFLLYAALHSGVHCNFLSRDLMRDHKACLEDSATRRLFFKWQRGHQLVISHYVPGKRVRFQRISAYDTIVQTSGSSWHIPYDENGSDRATYEVPQKWLCLTQEQ
ncbi:mitochondrial ribonuclease P catalytic subunit isoform X1 [Megalobrama amblycephala]|uniref:mitochondrial ribonuclease P catalytic subunit isoform X1 n=2 Tax=Megalobrama amblycephala TaxID=75352 RepID=UPI002013F8C1|nr:mitochondrial ribonuclease P catalytic subunit isoform X1 [Megalobrama amblycephala]